MSKIKKEKTGKVIYCKFIRKNGKIIYPKNGKFFKFVIKDDK